jgi:eukaryotic-like serine/threonine-protein kinase
MSLDRLDEVFHTARNLPAANWESFAERECADDTEIRRTLLAMLRQKEDAFAWFSEAESSLGLFWDDAVPELLGPYRVLRLLGRGGMGTVYLAERRGEGFVQTVAVKCMRRVGAEIHRRFLEERMILSRLEHSGIARLLDGGRTESGEPYLVMEYVQGEPLAAWIRKGPTLGERMRLFSAVGSAVEYAHRNLVVHRDLKPSNILVTGDGQPKLLDFGIAKLLDATGHSVAETEPSPLTPVYAAPEQLQGGAITTLTDVYGLGAVLYELLSGHRPSGATPALPVGVDRDLGQIACKALERRPEDRYQSVTEMLDDLRSYEAGFPVHAHGDGWTYRGSKYMQRHWIGTTFIVLLMATVTALWLQSAQLSRERERASMVAHLVPELFAGGVAGEVLDRNLPPLRGRLTAQPLVWADLLEAAGHAYRKMGERERAAQLFQEALEVRTRELGDQNAEVAETRRHLADLHSSVAEPR